jgi:hypothetical protein
MLEAARLGITLVTWLLADTFPAGPVGSGNDRSAFAIDYEARTVTCPGQASHNWYPTAVRGKSAIVVKFAAGTCWPCPARAQCTTARGGRSLTLPPRELHDLQAAARAGQAGKGWKHDYACRADIETTISQPSPSPDAAAPATGAWP